MTSALIPMPKVTAKSLNAMLKANQQSNVGEQKPSRFMLKIDCETQSVTMNPIPIDCYIISKEQFIRELEIEGYIVMKRRDFIAKITDLFKQTW